MKRGTKHAVHVAILALQLDASSNEIQLTPDGAFRAADGRPKTIPHWNLNATLAAKIIERESARKTPIVIDYEHQSLKTAANGQPAPAAGWFRGEDIVYRPGEGLFAKVTWTERAKQMIAADEYKYISPVLVFAKNGDVVGIINAALTNTPALDGMREVEARAAASFGFSADPDEETPTVNFMQRLIAALGLKADADEDAVAEAVVALKQNADELKQTNETQAGEIAALKQTSETPDPEKFVSVEVVEELRGQVAALSTKITDNEVEDLIQAALNDERGPLLLESQLKWARDLGAKNIDALKQYLETATPIAALRGRQTGGRDMPNRGAEQMGDEQIGVLKNLGLGDKDIESMTKEKQ